ncbi:MAG: HigA family addiction module antidote protein [Prevotella sp.]|nr:HigA family addiction module antidote protein [Prevotella sp.]
MAATRIEDLFVFNSLNFEALENGYYSIRTHPGDVLKEELEARGISQKKFSEVLSIPYTQLNEILNGKRPVTTDFALMMEAALGINPEMLINMQTRYNMSVARQKKPLLARLIDIKRACAAVF